MMLFTITFSYTCIMLCTHQNYYILITAPISWCLLSHTVFLMLSLYSQSSVDWHQPTFTSLVLGGYNKHIYARFSVGSWLQFSWVILSSCTAGSYTSFEFLDKPLWFPYKGCTTFHSHQQSLRFHFYCIFVSICCCFLNSATVTGIST